MGCKLNSKFQASICWDNIKCLLVKGPGRARGLSAGRPVKKTLQNKNCNSASDSVFQVPKSSIKTFVMIHFIVLQILQFKSKNLPYKTVMIANFHIAPSSIVQVPKFSVCDLLISNISYCSKLYSSDSKIFRLWPL